MLVTNSLLSAGGQDGKIPPGLETPTNQSDYRIFFYLARSRAAKKKNKKINVFNADETKTRL